MNFRRLSPEDRDACVAVAADCGWDRPLALWEMLLRHGDGYGLEHDGVLAGTIIAFPHEGLTFIGMMLIRQNAQGRGFGRALLEHALERANQPAALIATAYGRPLYEKLGFTPQDDVAIHEGVWKKALGVDAAVHEPAALSRADVEYLVKTDARAFGRRRDRLIAGMLERAHAVAIIAEADQTWYAMATQEVDAVSIGPVIAPNDEVAQRLVGSLASPGDNVRVRALSSHREYRTALDEAGLHASRALPFMTRGECELPNDAWYAVGLMATG